MEPFELTVYDKTGEVVKTCTAKPVDLEFGTIRSLMELLNVDNIEDTSELLRVVYGAWDELIGILGRCFPDMEYDDWSHIPLKELIPTLVQILRYSVGEILTIPKDEKN
jgi:hypothetical protein